MKNAFALAVIPLVLVLSACNPGEPEPTSTPGDKPTSTITPKPTSSVVAEEPLPDDALLLVRATATADNGAVMNIRMTVHRSLAWSTPEGASMGDVMSTSCAGALDASIYQDQLWTFTALDVDAELQGTTPWPTDQRLYTFPSAEYVAQAITDYPFDDDVDGGTPHCKRDKFFERPGFGTVVLGLPGDTDEVSAAGQFTRWANHSYGIAAPGGVILSDCSSLVTTAGEALHGGADWWSSEVSASACRYGALSEDVDS